MPPQAVVHPRHVDEVLATADVCRRLGVPITARGAGTSIAGNAVGPGVVIDFTRDLDRVLHIDVEKKRASVEPGVVVHAALQRTCAPHGLRSGPDPSSHSRCTIGGMIGNACGSRALGYGRTSDNVLGLDIVTAAGERLRLGDSASQSGTLDRLRELTSAHLGMWRTELGRFGRQISGYSLEHLLPEPGFDVARALVGSEGTLAIVLGADVRLVSEPAHRVLVVLGYPDMPTAADAGALDSRVVTDPGWAAALWRSVRTGPAWPPAVCGVGPRMPDGRTRPYPPTGSAVICATSTRCSLPTDSMACRTLRESGQRISRSCYNRLAPLAMSIPRGLVRHEHEAATGADRREGSTAMQYLLLIYGDETAWESATPEETKQVMDDYWAFGDWLKGQGCDRGGEALQPTTQATTVRVRDGKPVTTDGPFAETREQLGGYYLVECDNLDQAIEAASRIPGARDGSVEIRPVIDFSAEQPPG